MRGMRSLTTSTQNVKIIKLQLPILIFPNLKNKTGNNLFADDTEFIAIKIFPYRNRI